MKPLDQAFDIIEEGRRPIGKIDKVYEDPDGLVIEFHLFPGWKDFNRTPSEDSDEDPTDYDNNYFHG